MPKKIRVYELAHELGLTNKEALDLCLSLGMGVKSHSSSIEDAQADRARRKADREGLRRPVQPEEPAPPAKKAAATKKAAAKKVAPETTPTADPTPPRRPGSGPDDRRRAPGPDARGPVHRADQALRGPTGHQPPSLRAADPGPGPAGRPRPDRAAAAPLLPSRRPPGAAVARPAGPGSGSGAGTTSRTRCSGGAGCGRPGRGADPRATASPGPGRVGAERPARRSALGPCPRPDQRVRASDPPSPRRSAAVGDR